MEKFNEFKEWVAKSMSRICSSLIFDKEKRNKSRPFLRNHFRKWLDVQGPGKTAYNHKYIYHAQEGSNVILKKLQTGAPCLVARFGETELSTLRHFMTDDRYSIKYPNEIKDKMSNNAGFFPATDNKISRFSSELLDVVKKIDVMACWHLPGEEEVVNQYCTGAQLVGMECTNPLLFKMPWTQYLKGKKVLIIHPFVDTIEKQFEHREYLFENPLTLPDFELKTLKAVQSIADSKSELPYEDWFEALEEMCQAIDKIDFDIALIGAGAYGVFLGSHCKSIGKQAIHMGGVTQILFGVMGGRYDNELRAYNIKLNEYWTRPSLEERPKGLEKVEGGCYW